ncbi:MAG TPA: cupin-like domain-containing protein [Polyangia bacterium]|jgi:lysine-specific demethylase 8|nr:cupin-like domain-containing protein [Polyangia bacterium]
MPTVLAVERVAPPTPDEFLARFLRPRRPVVIRGLTDGWRMRSAFTFDALAQRYGPRQVAVAAADDGVLNRDTRAGVHYTTMPLADYVARLSDEKHPGLYLMTPLDRFLPELLAELDVPPYCSDARWRRSRLWMSAAGTVSPLHWDIPDNLIVHLAGRKRFWLYPPEATGRLSPHPPFSGLPNFSRFDPEQADAEQFPLGHAEPRHEVTLEPGDVLFLPSRWWHHVRSLERALSVNFWWANGWRAMAARAAEAWRGLRGFDAMKR